MDNKNIFKIKLRIMKKDVIEIMPKLFSVNYQTFIDNRIFDEIPEEYIKNLIGKFLELHINNPKYWNQLDLLVYWDMNDYFGYEIITGIKIPLFLISEYKNDTQNIGLNCNNYQYKTLLLYNYPLIANYGYFGQLNGYNIYKTNSLKLNLRYSIDDLNYLRAYIESHKDIDLYNKNLSIKLEECKKTIDDITKQMILEVNKNYENSNYNSIVNRNIENESEEILKALKYRIIIKKK